ncbi:MAG: ABC transporter permease [Deltaproteobacteria bacterium]|nr:ABC transporter permease [Deltaproteobacteria bacterium]
MSSSAPKAAGAIPVSRIEPRATWQLSELAEIWRYRELLWMLALRDLKIRYKQTAVGVAWAVLQPLVTLGLFGTLFNLLQAAPSSSGLPYALTTYCGLLPWQVFSSSVTLSARSLVTNQDLIRKVYFPRILVPAIPLVIGLIDFAIASTVLVAMMIAYQIEPTRAILLSPLFVGMTALAALGAGLWLSALNSLYRDVQQATPA